MEILRIVIGSLIVILLAGVMAWTETMKHPAAKLYVWLGAISILVLVRFLL